MAGKPDAIRHAMTGGASLQRLEIAPLTRTLRAADLPADPVRLVAQQSKRFDARRLSLQGLHPAHLNDHHVFGLCIELASDRRACIRVGLSSPHGVIDVF